MNCMGGNSIMAYARPDKKL